MSSASIPGMSPITNPKHQHFVLSDRLYQVTFEVQGLKNTCHMSAMTHYASHPNPRHQRPEGPDKANNLHNPYDSNDPRQSEDADNAHVSRCLALAVHMRVACEPNASCAILQHETGLKGLAVCTICISLINQNSKFGCSLVVQVFAICFSLWS